MKSSAELVILLSLVGIISANSKPVLVRDNTTQQLYTSSLLTWETFTNDPNQLKHAVSAGAFLGEDVRSWSQSTSSNYAINILFQNSKTVICRSTINSIPVSGYVKKRVVKDEESYVCIISQHSQFRTKGQFEVLLNKGEGAKMNWVKWNKMIAFGNINGAVSTLNGAGVSFPTRNMVWHA